MKLIEAISNHISAINIGITEMIEARKSANKQEINARAEAYTYKVKPYFETLRYHCDKLELLVEDKLWPLTKSRELLFFE